MESLRLFESQKYRESYFSICFTDCSINKQFPSFGSLQKEEGMPHKSPIEVNLGESPLLVDAVSYCINDTLVKWIATGITDCHYRIFSHPLSSTIYLAF